VINGTNLLGKDNPRWSIGNATETMKVLDAMLPAPRGPVVLETAISTCPATGIGSTLRTASAIALAWLIGQPRRLGNRLFAINDAEAGWRCWQVTELAAGLGRRYRDARFGTPRDPADRSWAEP
jgi:hypothetical protein